MIVASNQRDLATFETTPTTVAFDDENTRKDDRIITW